MDERSQGGLGQGTGALARTEPYRQYNMLGRSEVPAELGRAIGANEGEHMVCEDGTMTGKLLSHTSEQIGVTDGLFVRLS